MTESPEKLVIYSASCVDGSYGPVSDGSLKTMEVSKVTYDAKPMSQKDIKAAADKLSNAVDAFKALIDFRKAFLDNKDEIQKLLKDKLEMVAGVGDILKGVLKFIPGEPNPMIEKLRDLEKKVEELGEKISENFSETKALVTEIDFFNIIISPANVLARHQRDCMKHPGPEARQNFKNAYNKRSPMKLAYDLISILEQDSTNPLKLAMDAEAGKTKATFSKWEDIIQGVLLQLVAMFRVPRRDAATLLPIIKHHVLNKTLIVSDGWAVYGGIKNLQKEFDHQWVNHKVNFVDPSDRRVHTQSIEATWGAFKRSLKSKAGVPANKLDGHMANYMFRRGNNHSKLLNHLLIEMQTYRRDTSPPVAPTPSTVPLLPSPTPAPSVHSSDDEEEEDYEEEEEEDSNDNDDDDDDDDDSMMMTPPKTSRKHAAQNTSPAAAVVRKPAGKAVSPKAVGKSKKRPRRPSNGSSNDGAETSRGAVRGIPRRTTGRVAGGSGRGVRRGSPRVAGRGAGGSGRGVRRGSPRVAGRVAGGSARGARRGSVRGAGGSGRRAGGSGRGTGGSGRGTGGSGRGAGGSGRGAAGSGRVAGGSAQGARRGSERGPRRG